ncbi:hypothetical protein RB2083_2246 [Rhodobacteraceae bacterium HTCC2083]|nr:hypothetical protein RB2083_2246 [Rhodobacteraceae bacterium HTCC2083]
MRATDIITVDPRSRQIMANSDKVAVFGFGAMGYGIAQF